LRENGEVCAAYELSEENTWSDWVCGQWAGPGGPEKVIDIAASDLGNGCLQFWAIDNEGQVWAVREAEPGVVFKDWSKWPDNAPYHQKGMRRLVAAPDSAAPGGARVWAINLNNSLLTVGEITPGGQWGWEQPYVVGKQPSYSDVTAIQHADGRQQVWTLDSKRLMSIWQNQPGGDWSSGWNTWPAEQPFPVWENAPPLIGITACDQSGGRGAAVWGVTEDHTLICNYQESPGSSWNGWSQGNWLDAPPVSTLTASQLSNGAVQLWVLTTDGWLFSTKQKAAGGDWGNWVGGPLQ
jgi:hypothetical protein